jgi:predicted nucleotidyltransferase
LCKKHKVDKIFGFGSAFNGGFDDLHSDIDVVVELSITDPLDYGETILQLWNDLEKYFNRKVDLLTESSIKNPYFRKSVDHSKRIIYDGQREKILV